MVNFPQSDSCSISFPTTFFRYCTARTLRPNNVVSEVDSDDCYYGVVALLSLGCSESSIQMMKILSESEARHLFQAARVARLGCIVNGAPYVVPINCYLEGNDLFSHSLPGQKITG